MNPVRIAWRAGLTLALVVAGGLGAATKPAGGQIPADYSAFRIIAARNIFNTNRSVRGSRTAATRPPKIEALALTGTLSYEKGTFAFFDGTSVAYRKVLRPEDTIAGYRVTQISPEAATLEANGKQIELRVGGQLRRADKGEWEVAANPVAYSSNSKRKSVVLARSSGSSSKGGSRRKPTAKHSHRAGPDAGQYSKSDLKAFLKAESEMYSKEERSGFSKEELRGFSENEAKEVKAALKQMTLP